MWGVYKRWSDITKMQPRYYQGFNSRHDAEMWLQKEDKIPEDELKEQRAKQPEIIDLTACETADAVTLDDVKSKHQRDVQDRVEARVRNPRRKTSSKAKRTTHQQVQSKVTQFFTPSEVQSRINKDRGELVEAVRRMHDDKQDDERMHRNIATANEIDNDYSRLVSAAFMEDENRRHTHLRRRRIVITTKLTVDTRKWKLTQGRNMAGGERTAHDSHQAPHPNDNQWPQHKHRPIEVANSATAGIKT